MPNSSSYEKVIDLLIGNKINAQDVLVMLAKRYPDTLLEIADLLNPSKKAYLRGHQQIVLDLIRGNKVSAIKKMREMTSFGLKEAKDIIDVAHVRLWKERPADMPRPSDSLLDNQVMRNWPAYLEEQVQALIAAARGPMPVDLVFGNREGF